MTHLQSNLQRACRELDLAIVAPFLLKLADASVIHASALLPQLGAAKGMIIVTDFALLHGIDSALVDMGYGYSVLSEPSSQESFDLDGYIEMFSDWGWAHPDDPRPAWMT